MHRFIWACFVVIGASSVGKTEEPPKSSVVKKLVQDIGAATFNGEHTKVIDLTYEGVIRQMGGREKALEEFKALEKQMKARSVSYKAYHVDDPGEFLTENGNTFVVIPTTLEMAIPGGKIISKSYLLGISPDEGKTWKFAEGTGISKHKDELDKFLPKLPANLKLPELKKAEIVKDK